MAAVGLVLAAALLVSVAPARAAGPRIQGGSLVTAPDAWPWSVVLVINDTVGVGLCSGQLIGPTTVLTAAHCVGGAGDVIKSIDVTHDRSVAGTFNGGPVPPDAIAATSWTWDHRFKINNLALVAYDFGIVTLPAPIPGTSYLPLVQPDQAAPYETGGTFTGLDAGYGLTDPNGQDAGVMHQIELQGSYCSVASSCSSTNPYLLVQSSQPRGTCPGDSGGGFIVSLPGTTLPVASDPTVSNGDWAVLGTVSQGPPGACNSTVFDTVADDAAWLLPFETPAAFVAPSISGTPLVGDALQCDPGTWSTAVTPSYQWQTVGTGSPVPIAGATGAMYAPIGTDAGTQIQCAVHATAAGFGYAGSATSVPVTVGAATTLTYTGPTSGAYGQPVTLSATLTDAATHGGLSGQQVSLGFGAEQCTATTDGSGAASCQATPIDAPAGSPYTITASFAATGPYAGASDTSTSFTVQKAGTTTQLLSSANPSTVGQAVTYTATVARTVAGFGAPSGTVAFSDGGTPVSGCGQVTLAAGQATCQVTYPTVAGSPHQISASYSGDPDFKQGNDSLSQTVAQAPTTLVAAPAKFGLLSVTFSATLTRSDTGAPLPSRTIGFSVHGTTVCQTTTNASGVAHCTVAPALIITLGPSSYTARFAGDTNDQPSSATGQLTSGLTLAGATLARAFSGHHDQAIRRATLGRAGVVYAVGTGRLTRNLIWIKAKLLHPVKPARYTLNLTLTNHTHVTRTITLR